MYNWNKTWIQDLTPRFTICFSTFGVNKLDYSMRNNSNTSLTLRLTQFFNKTGGTEILYLFVEGGKSANAEIAMATVQPVWRAYCNEFDFDQGVFRLAIDGIEVFSNTDVLNSFSMDTSQGVSMEKLFKFNLWEPGKFTLFNIHDDTKSLEMIRCSEEGNLYAWDSYDWVLPETEPFYPIFWTRVQDICGSSSLLLVNQQGWKLMSQSHCQEMCQLAVLASDWLFTLVQPIRSQLAY